MVYQDLQFRSNFLVANPSGHISPCRPCLCHSALHVFATLLSTPLLAPPLLSIVDSIYLKDWTVGKLTISVSMYLFILTGSISSVVCRCSVFALLSLSPLFSIHYLHLPSLTSIISLSGSHTPDRPRTALPRAFLPQSLP